MNLFGYLWNTPPRKVFRRFFRRFEPPPQGPRWVTIKSGPLAGREIYLASDRFIGWKMMLSGRYDEFIFDKVTEYPNLEGAVVWDIGAHFGYHTMAFAAMVGPGGQVVAFDPNGNNRKRFQVNLERNQDLRERIQLEPIAVSSSNGEEILISSANVDDSTSTGSHLETARPPLAQTAYAAFEREVVETSTADAYLDQRKCNAPAIIKIDVEGAEAAVLEGAKGLIEMYKPWLFIEVHHIVLMHYIETFLLSYHYAIEILDESNADASRCFIFAKPKYGK